MKNVKHARCIKCGATHDASPDITTCSCGGVMDIEYDYDYISSRITRAEFAKNRDYTMWRYRELLPVEDNSPAPPLRTGWSPMYSSPSLAELVGAKYLFIKDDGQNPTSSLKDRASAMALVKAREAGYSKIACASTGNAASSLAGACAAAGMESFIFVPERAPVGKVAQLLIFGANVISVQGDYGAAFRLSAEAIERYGWYNRNAAINPYLMEGKKTVSFEIAEQLLWEIPDYVAVSVGDGCTIAGIWKGFKDLYAVGLIKKLPKLVSVQAAGCWPINRSARERVPLAPMEENTIADSIAVGVPRNPDKAISAIQESGGVTVEVTDEEILEAMRILGSKAGVFGEPAGVTGMAGIIKASETGLIPPNSSIVSVITGNGLKDTANGIKAAGEPVRIPPDMSLLEKALGECAGK